MKFFLKKSSDLDEADFQLFQIWAEYYEPDDVDSLVRLGYGLDEVQNELMKVDYSDCYAFPIPPNGINESFHYIFLAINAKLACGNILRGYCCSQRAFAIVLFHNNKNYTFNLNLKDLALKKEAKLKNDMGIIESIFPIQIEILPLQKKGVFTFPPEVS